MKPGIGFAGRQAGGTPPPLSRIEKGDGREGKVMGKKSKTETPEVAFESGVGHDGYESGTDLRLMWKWEKRYMLDWIILDCCKIISPTKKPDSKDCKKYCMGCRYFPQPIHFDPERIFSLYCPEYDVNNLCSFLAMQYYCDKLYEFLRDIGIDEITNDLFQEVEAICNLISKKVYMLMGVHDEVLVKKESQMPGANAMKEKGRANNTAIARVLADMGIESSLSVFRKDKKLRENFLERAKKATHDPIHGGCLSTDRINKIARSLLKGKSPV